ncbi:MAG: RnfABCDGE type electron transport complex subunit B [Caulobacteraceae bacterium]
MINNILWPVITLGGIAVFFGIVLAYASKKFAVETDPKVGEIREILPGANCGGCGYAGCDACAEAIAKGVAPVSACPVGGSALAAKIAGLMGVEATDSERMVARVICCGDKDNANQKYEYQGIQDCKAAEMLAGGAKSCRFGCTGLGTCVKACPFDAIHVINGVAVVDEKKCTACKKCIAACPKGIIELVPESKQVRVLCKNTEKGKAVMQACKVGCIACQKCVKVCKFDAIKVENNLARIDYGKCVNCMMCAEVCPNKTIYANFANRKKAVINDDKCIGCTICKKQCNFEAIEGELKAKHKVLDDKCVGCGQCYEKCPKGAIEMK